MCIRDFLALFGTYTRCFGILLLVHTARNALSCEKPVIFYSEMHTNVCTCAHTQVYTHVNNKTNQKNPAKKPTCAPFMAII